MAGMCDVPIPPTILATSASDGRQPRAEFFDAHPGLLRAHVLDVEPEDARELREVIDVAAGGNHRQYVAATNRVALRGVEPVPAAVILLIAQERHAVLRVVEREAHLVECIATACRGAVENSGAPDFATVWRGLERRCFPGLGHGRSMPPRGSADIRKATYAAGEWLPSMDRMGRRPTLHAHRCNWTCSPNDWLACRCVCFCEVMRCMPMASREGK